MKEFLTKVLNWLKTAARWLGEAIGLLEKATKDENKPQQ